MVELILFKPTFKSFRNFLNVFDGIKPLTNSCEYNWGSVFKDEHFLKSTPINNNLPQPQLNE